MKLLLQLALAGGVALAALPAAAATAPKVTTVPVGTYPSPAQTAFFYLTSGTPTSPSITANFGDTIKGSATSFEDFFDFTIPQNGLGSGSVSTSFSAKSNELTISDVLINGVSYALSSSKGGQAVTVNDIPISYDVKNVIEVIGSTVKGASAATFAGTATFASAAPEPATWLLMIGGIGMIGSVLRRRPTAVGFA